MDAANCMKYIHSMVPPPYFRGGDTIHTIAYYSHCVPLTSCNDCMLFSVYLTPYNDYMLFTLCVFTNDIHNLHVSFTPLIVAYYSHCVPLTSCNDCMLFSVYLTPYNDYMLFTLCVFTTL